MLTPPPQPITTAVKTYVCKTNKKSQIPLGELDVSECWHSYMSRFSVNLKIAKLIVTRKGVFTWYTQRQFQLK